MLAYKISKCNIQKASNNNFSLNYLHDDRHLRRNRSTGKMFSGIELLCRNIYCAAIGKQLNRVHWQNPYTTLAEITGIWNLVSHILKGTNIRHTEMENLHCRFIKLHAHSNKQVVSPISVMQNCKWSLRSLLFQSNSYHIMQNFPYIYLKGKFYFIEPYS